jgi:IS5 family transposase
MTPSKKTSRYVTFAKIAYGLAQRNYPMYRRGKSKKTFSQPQLVACVLLMMYLNQSYRDFEEWLYASDQVCAALELKRVPDHSTLNRAFHRLTETRMRRLLDTLLKQLKVKEEVVAGDSTGYTLSQASAYYRTRSGQRFRGWIKGSYAVGTQSQLILAAYSSRRNSPNDAHMLQPLRNGAKPYVRKRHWLFLADAGFDCQAVTARDIIPPIRRGGRLVAPERKARADLVAQARLDGLFGQRWKTETVHSVIKRKFGDQIRSTLKSRQNREPIIKAVVYNIHC